MKWFKASWQRWRRRSGWKSTNQESFVCGALEGWERARSFNAWPRWMNLQKADDVDACWYSTQHGFPLVKCRLKPLRWCLPWSCGTFCSCLTATALSWRGRWSTSNAWISRMWSRSSNVVQDQLVRSTALKLGLGQLARLRMMFSSSGVW